MVSSPRSLKPHIKKPFNSGIRISNHASSIITRTQFFYFPPPPTPMTAPPRRYTGKALCTPSRTQQYSSTAPAQALYALFAANDEYLRVLQKGCFSYFEREGDCVSGPAGLLAGITRQPMVLFFHFFAVAFWSIGVMFKNMEPWEYALGLLKSIAKLR